MKPTEQQIDERRQLADTPGITLDGKPAKITGIKLQFATVSNDDASFQWNWDAVKRIVSSNGKFFS